MEICKIEEKVAIQVVIIKKQMKLKRIMKKAENATGQKFQWQLFFDTKVKVKQAAPKVYIIEEHEEGIVAKNILYICSILIAPVLGEDIMSYYGIGSNFFDSKIDSNT